MIAAGEEGLRVFIVDDILLSPVRGFMWILRELHRAAEGEIEGEADRLTHRLSQLYMRLETGQITEAEFEAEEEAILDRLDAIRGDGTGTVALGDDDGDHTEEEA